MNELRNTRIEAPQETQLEVASKKKKQSGGIQFFRSVLGGSFLTRDKVVRFLPYLLFLTLIAVVYIFNSNHAVRTVIQINRTKKQNSEYRYEYLTTKSNLMKATRQSELAKKLEARGILESKVPPKKISSHEKQ